MQVTRGGGAGVCGRQERRGDVWEGGGTTQTAKQNEEMVGIERDGASGMGVDWACLGDVRVTACVNFRRNL